MKVEEYCHAQKFKRGKKPLESGGRTVEKRRKNLEVLISNYNRMIGKVYSEGMLIIMSNNKYWMTVNKIYKG